MRKFAVLAVLAAGAAALPSAVLAEGGTFRGRAGLAGVSYVSPSGDSSPDLESTYGAATIGGSYVSSAGWFTDLGVRTSLGAKWNTNEFSGGALEDEDFSRTEATLTIGKGLGSGFSVFGGLQVANSEFSILGESMDLDGQLLFVGASKALSIGAGTLSFSGALGLLQQEITNSSTPSGNAESDSGAGASLGVAYSYPVLNNLSVMADLRFQSYAVEYGDESNNESVTAIGISAVGQF